MAARKRLMSRICTTDVDGLENTANQSTERSLPLRRSTKLGSVLSQGIGHSWSTPRRYEKSEKRRRGKAQASRTNYDEEYELEKSRWLKELREAEAYELIVEYDDSYHSPNELGKGDSKLAEVNDVNDEKTNEQVSSVGDVGNCPAKEDKFSMNINEALALPLLFPQPVTSTPLKPTHLACPLIDLSPITNDEENITLRNARERSPLTPCKSLREESALTSPRGIINEARCLMQGENEELHITFRSIDETALSQLTILHSPRRWGFGDEDYVNAEGVSTTSEKYTRGLLLYDGNSDDRPFYLNGFPWTAQYAKKRNYKRELLHLCNQRTIRTWGATKALLDLSNPLKLGEGLYGEVFLVKYEENIVSLKIIPVGGMKIVNGDKQKSFRDIAAELIVSKELSDLNQAEDGNSTGGFVRLVGAMVVKGSYPKSLISAWEKYDEQIKSGNDHPRIFNPCQHFLLLAFENSGIDLEKYTIGNIFQAYSIVYQVMVALCVAEYRLSFEHRDLHMGNILIKRVEQDALVREDLNGTKVWIRTYGAEVKIIGFTFSRMSKGTSTIFYDLANNEKFFANEGCLQYDIYRTMRTANKNDWFSFCSLSNVMWVIYLVRHIYDNVNGKGIGSIKERKEFIYHFRNLHRYASLSEWLVENMDRKSNIVRLETDSCSETEPGI